MENLNSKKSYSEVYEILNILGEDFINKVPRKLYNLIDTQRDFEYKPNLLNEEGMLDENLLSKEAIALFAVLNYKYFMQDENEKEELMKMLNHNQEKYEKEQREKYNPDNIFKKNMPENKIEDIEKEKNELLPANISKENIFTKIKKWFKNLLCKK